MNDQNYTKGEKSCAGTLDIFVHQKHVDLDLLFIQSLTQNRF